MNLRPSWPRCPVSRLDAGDPALAWPAVRIRELPQFQAHDSYELLASPKRHTRKRPYKFGRKCLLDFRHCLSVCVVQRKALDTS